MGGSDGNIPPNSPYNKEQKEEYNDIFLFQPSFRFHGFSPIGLCLAGIDNRPCGYFSLPLCSFRAKECIQCDDLHKSAAVSVVSPGTVLFDNFWWEVSDRTVRDH